MKVGLPIINCKYTAANAASFTDATGGVAANQEDTGYLAVSLDGDNTTTGFVPQVKLADTDTESVYGVAATINPRSRTVGVIVGGIVPVRYQTAPVTGDIGQGIRPDGGTAGRAKSGSAAGNGRGTVVGRTGNIAFVDLDVNTNGV